MLDIGERIGILLVDDDERLIMDADGLDHPGVTFTFARSTAEARIRRVTSRYEVKIVSLDIAGGDDLIRETARRPHGPRVIAIGARPASGATLEHTLLRAELRGASLSLPKPIDAVELAIAAVTLCAEAAARADSCRNIASDLQRRIAY